MRLLPVVLAFAFSSALVAGPPISYVDLNFDGHADKLVFLDRGGGRNACNETYEASLYDPRTRRYVRHDALSEVGSIEAHPENKTITGYWRCGPEDTFSVYRWKGGDLVLIEETTYARKENGVLTTVKKLRNGKLAIVSTTFDEAQ